MKITVKLIGRLQLDGNAAIFDSHIETFLNQVGFVLETEEGKVFIPWQSVTYVELERTPGEAAVSG